MIRRFLDATFKNVRYAQLLCDDPAYAAKARRVVELARDVAEFVPQALAATAVAAAALTTAATARHRTPTDTPPMRVAFHPPCTLQHALKIRGQVEALLVALGAELVPVRDTHLCCGSAGTYSLLQPRLSQTLRARKLETLLENRPQAVLSANIGCIAHLQGATETPVLHWIEWVDEMLAARTGR